MFAIDAMEYGVFPMEFPVPKGFAGPYPTRCGYLSAHAPFSAGNSGGALVYLLRGSGAAVCAGESSNFFPGCIAVAEQAEQLMLYPEEQTEYLYLLLENAQSFLALIGQETFVWDASGGRADRLLARLCYNAAVRREDGLYAVSADVYALLMELCGQCARAAYSPLVRQAMALMREDYAFLTGVEELAQRMGVTASHLIRCFSAETGQSPGRYLQTVKLDNAKLMLQNRDYTIDMIADMVGYSGSNYFCKVFRRETGQSPGQYRAAHIAGARPDPEAGRRLEELESKLHL